MIPYQRSLGFYRVDPADRLISFTVSIHCRFITLDQAFRLLNQQKWVNKALPFSGKFWRLRLGTIPWVNEVVWSKKNFLKRTFTDFCSTA
jgi:hypothetical protein